MGELTEMPEQGKQPEPAQLDQPAQSASSSNGTRRGGRTPREYTPTEERLLAVLGDGMDHSPAELMGCLYDEMSGRGTLSTHIHHLRKKLQRKGTDIVCVANHGRRAPCYRYVRLIRRGG